MPDDHPPIVDLAIAAWRYAFASFSRMPSVLGVAMLLVFIVNLVTLPLMSVSSDASIGTEIVSLLIKALLAFLVTPVAIAVHRFVLLGEVTEHYAPSFSDQRFMRFFTFSIAFQVLTLIPATLMSLAMKYGGIVGTPFGLAFFALLVFAVITSLRLLILFPAIAVDARGAHFRNAIDDTKGHTWSVLFVVVATALPAILVELPFNFVFGWPPEQPGLGGGIVLSILQAVIGVLSLAAFAAAASQLFAAYANRLNG
jgi:hypothetical protein